MIKIGDRELDAAASLIKGELNIVIRDTQDSVDTLEEFFASEEAAEIRIEEGGKTEAVYKRCSLSSIRVNMDDGKRNIVVRLNVERIEKSDADELRELLAQQAKMIAMLQSKVDALSPAAS